MPEDVPSPMLDQATLTTDLERLRGRLELDITERAEEEASISADLRQRYEAARAAKRTGLGFELWRAGEVTQSAVAWLLACVFVRFLEDNYLIEQPWISGPANRLDEAKEQNLRTYRAGQWQTDRDYLLLCFEEIRKLPGVSALVDKEHNPLFRLTPTGHGARSIIDFFQKLDDHNNLVHDFSCTIDNTRFLGDLYQNISESARKRYALVQTPDFVVDFILDRTMEPALQEFGLEAFRIIDPACGSGHFLIAAFERLFHKRQKRLPPIDPIDCASRALASIYGVDVNPFAIAIARFRLLVAALHACDVRQLSEAPDFKTNLAVGDSLLHGSRPGTSGAVQRHAFDDALNFFYETEDKDKLRDYLRHETFHAVVGNPPYITVQDAVLRDVYRDRFNSCSGKYHLSVPFTELFFDLAIRGERAGYVGMITSSAFMKRGFGAKLIEGFLPNRDLTCIIDMSGAYIPGHATPTVLLFGRNCRPVSNTVRFVRSIQAEKKVPEAPSFAPVWTAIASQVDKIGSRSRWVSVDDVDRSTTRQHPWSIGGGGAAELKELIDGMDFSLLDEYVESAGITAFTLEDDICLLSPQAAARHQIPPSAIRPFVVGEIIRDWQIRKNEQVVAFPYDEDFKPFLGDALHQYLWPTKAVISRSILFGGKTKLDSGLKWYEFGRLTASKLRTPLSIPFAFVATHNQFALARGKQIFNRTAPILKLRETLNEEDHAILLGTLNSSLCCFWLKQVCQDKGGGGIGGGLATEASEKCYEHNAKPLVRFPVAPGQSAELVNTILRCVDERTALLPENFFARELPSNLFIREARAQANALLHRMIALQEELDWGVYHLYSLTRESITLLFDQIPEIKLGQRAFEIVMARQIAEGDLETEWFNRHGSTPTVQIPTHWPEPYRQLVQRRIDTISADRDIALIEQPEYKRRWNLPKWEDLENEALRNGLLDRLKHASY